MFELAKRLDDPTHPAELLRRNYTLFGGVVTGMDGQLVELQARAVQLLRKSVPWRTAVTISGRANSVLREALDRISGAFNVLNVPQPTVEILVNLAPPSLDKNGTWLDLPLAVILLQAAGILPDFPDDFEAGLHLDWRSGAAWRDSTCARNSFPCIEGSTWSIASGARRERERSRADPGQAWTRELCYLRHFPVGRSSQVL